MCFVAEFDYIRFLYQPLSSLCFFVLYLIAQLYLFMIKNVFHHLNVAKKWKICNLLPAYFTVLTFQIQRNLQKLYFSPRMHGLHEETCKLSKKKFQKLFCISLIFVLSAAVNMLKVCFK